MEKTKKTCAYCGAPLEGNGRDGDPLVVGRVCKDCDVIRFKMSLGVREK